MSEEDITAVAAFLFLSRSFGLTLYIFLIYHPFWYHFLQLCRTVTRLCPFSESKENITSILAVTMVDRISKFKCFLMRTRSSEEFRFLRWTISTLYREFQVSRSTYMNFDPSLCQLITQTWTLSNISVPFCVLSFGDLHHSAFLKVCSLPYTYGIICL